MQPIVFCARCRGIEPGWNRRYIEHLLVCPDWISSSAKLLTISVLIVLFVVAFPTSTETGFSDLNRVNLSDDSPAVIPPAAVPPSPAASAIEAFLREYRVDPTYRNRIAEAIVAGSRKHDLDPRLVASIMMVESSANPFAISSRNSVGIMQIHLPTWGTIADKDNINLFRIEDNVEFGARILSTYVRQFGLWEGVGRYQGWTDSPESQQAAAEYVEKVRHIYRLEPFSAE